MSGNKEENLQESGPSMEEKIVAAAERLFLENGYQMTSTTRIAREAGCNQALVHYYFRTKEKLFNAVLGDRIRQAFMDFVMPDAGEGTFGERLTRLIGFHYDVVRKNSDMVLFLINALTRNPEMLESLVGEIGGVPLQALKTFRSELEAEIAAGRIRPVSLHELLLNVISLNVFPFAARNIYSKVWNLSDGDMEALLDRRKQEIIDTILLSLRP